MRIEQLKYFLEVAKNHSIGIAAEKLFVTQPTVSIALKNLEQELGESLFTRSKNGVFLTEFGQMIYEKAQIIVDEERNLKALVKAHQRHIQEEVRGCLKIGTIPMITHAFFKETLLTFAKLYPSVQLIILDKNTAEIVEAVRTGDYDIGFFTADSPQIEVFESKPELVVKRFFSEKLYVVAASTFSFEGKLSLSFEDIKHLPLVTTNFNEDLGKNDVFDHQTVMNIVLKTSNLELLETYISSGTAIGVVFNSILSRIPGIAEMKVLPINLPYKIELCCTYAKDSDNLFLSNSFMTVMLELFHQNSIR